MTINTLAMMNGWEIVALLALVVIIFGAKKLPDLAKGLGQGIKEFKKATKDEEPLPEGTSRQAKLP